MKEYCYQIKSGGILENEKKANIIPVFVVNSRNWGKWFTNCLFRGSTSTPKPATGGTECIVRHLPVSLKAERERVDRQQKLNPEFMNLSR